MFLVISLDEFSGNNVFYSDKIKNTVIENSNFIRILYSNSYFILNVNYL